MAKQLKLPERKSLEARALFIMGQKAYRECRAYEERLGELLGYSADDNGYLGCISDEMHEENGSFDKGLRNEGFTIQPSKKR